MTGPSRPDTDRLSPAARNPAWLVAALAFGALVILALAVVLGIGQTRGDSRGAVAAGEHPSFPLSLDGMAAPPAPDPAANQKAAASPAAPAAAAPAQMGEAFIDRFDRVDVTDRWYFSDGWTNGPWMANDWRASEVEITPQGLSLNLRPTPAGSKFEYAGAEIQTRESYRYGYFEARMRVPRGSGLIIGMFTYAGRNESAKPNEIDIEILGRSTRYVELTIHETGHTTTKKINMPFDSADGYHTYGLDWQPGHVRWYLDGKLVHEEAGPAARRVVRPQKLLFSLWGSKTLGPWAGELRRSEAPWRLDLACVAYAPDYSGSLCN
jgi:endo-1,3-1,4-beta-glycanase ExoK